MVQVDSSLVNMFGRTLYQILGVGRGATTDQIIAAYERVVNDNPIVDFLGPNPGRLQAERLLMPANSALETLTDPTKRRSYDITLPPEPKPRSLGNPPKRSF